MQIIISWDDKKNVRDIAIKAARWYLSVGNTMLTLPDDKNVRLSAYKRRARFIYTMGDKICAM